jgi:hypothetical protein
MSNVSQFIGSGWIPLETIEVTSPVADVNFNSNIDDTFNNYVVTGTHTVSNNTFIYFRLKTGGQQILAGYRRLATYPGPTASSDNNPSTEAFISQYSGSFTAYLMNLRSSDQFKSIVSQGTGYDSGGTTMYVRNFTSALLDTSIIDGIRIILNIGATINTGKFTLYGIQEL